MQTEIVEKEREKPYLARSVEELKKKPRPQNEVTRQNKIEQKRKTIANFGFIEKSMKDIN